MRHVTVRDILIGCALIQKRRAKRKGKPPIYRLRVADVQRLIVLRHSGACDTDDAAIYLEAVARSHDDSQWLISWCSKWLPQMSPTERDDVLLGVARAPHRLSADAAGRLLRVTAVERQAAGITTIGAVDQPKRSRTKRRKMLSLERKRKARLAHGARPHKDSRERQAPWLRAGISRATWYRRMK